MTRIVSYGSDDGTINFGVPYYTISLSLNVLLTLLIVTRLALHHRAVNKALGTSAPSGGLYKALVTMLVESCALYAVSYLLFIGPWASGSAVSNIFFPILAETQVCADVFDATPILGPCCLTMVSKRLSLRSSSFYASPKREHGQGTPLSLGMLARSVRVVKGSLGVVMAPLLEGIPLARWTQVGRLLENLGLAFAEGVDAPFFERDGIAGREVI